MRVALLTYSAFARDAVGNYVAQKLAFFLERGAEVRVVVQLAGRLHPDIEPFCLPMERAEPVGDAWKFLASADLVVADYAQSYDLLNLLPLLSGGRQRIILDYHGVTPAELWPAHRAVLDRAARQRGVAWCADAVIAHSQFTSRELVQATGFPPERVTVMPYPLDLDTFSPTSTSRFLQRRLGLEHATFLLFVGRLARNKNLPALVEAVAHLRECEPTVHAVIIGDDGDVYAEEAHRCHDLAQQFGVIDRLHFLGQVTQEELLSAYRSADILVMPSRHEGFCLPVVEAMACGLPVIAARSTALPETVGDAGLTFDPGDGGDLARQVTRVIENPGFSKETRVLRPLRVAVVSVRYGTDFAGGAETSLRTMAETLHRAGHSVEVYTTCTRSEGDWSNELPGGTTTVNGLAVHRFPVDPCDRQRHLESVRRIVVSERPFSDEMEADYVRHSVHSSELLEALGDRVQSLDAILVGPYLFGLTCDVARAFPEKTLLVPCFHAESLARLRTWVEVYERVSGILYHAAEEREFAQSTLRINHPRGVVIGTLLRNPVSSKKPGFSGRYIVYCGRYSRQKRVDELLDFARRYEEQRPGRFRFAFLGEGEVQIPNEPWAQDWGFVDEQTKKALLAGAVALVQLSRQESLSLVALEAWAQGTPILADAGCAVLVGHLKRSGGGRAIDGYEDFARALDDVWDRPEVWQTMGENGREYVQRDYSDADVFAERLVSSIASLSRPIREEMRRRGLLRAACFSRNAWRDALSEYVDRVLHGDCRARNDSIEVRAYQRLLRVATGTKAVLVPLHVVQNGTQAALADGPGRTVLRAQVLDAETGRLVREPDEGPLPGLLIPGRPQAAAMSVSLPGRAGAYRLALWAERVDQDCTGTGTAEVALVELAVDSSSACDESRCCSPLLDVAKQALVEAHDRKTLPDDYIDVTHGLLTGLKRRIKRKMLGNFKNAYVDVLSRQQSEVNRHLVTAVQHLAECCATLDHAVRTLQNRLERLEEKLTTHPETHPCSPCSSSPTMPSSR